MIAFSCCRCGMKFNVKDEYAGRSTKCPTCKLALTVPLSDRTVAHVPEGQIDGTASSLAQAGVDGGVTVDQEVASPGQKSVSELLVRQSKKGQRYIIDKEIARGGMGAVLRAVDCDIRREVAVKYMLGETEPKQKLRFIEEAQITGQLEHPNIVPIHELGVDARKRVFFSMKMVKGRSLGQVLDELRQNPKKTDYSLIRLLNILVNVCNGLAYAHSRGVVHRDLKPANIMVGDFGEVYVMDWGLAKVLKGNGKATPMAMAVSGPPSAIASSSSKVATSREPDADLTQEGAILGTPVYMPPEQANGHVDAIDQRSDIYSLGAILYEMLTLQAPIEKEGGYLAILMRVTLGEIVPPEERVRRAGSVSARSIPSELSAVAMKALAKDPANRYPNVEALRKDIERFQEGRSVSAKEDTFREAVWKLVKRNKQASIITGIALLVLTIVLGIGFSAVNTARLNAEEANAGFKAEKEARRKQAVGSVPAYIRAARPAVNERKFDDALIQVNTALEYDADHADARLLKGQLLIVQLDFAAAAKELNVYLRLRPDDAKARKLAELCHKAKADNAAILREQKVDLEELMIRPDELFASRQELLVLSRKRIGTGSALANRLQLVNQELRLDLGTWLFGDLKALQGMNLNWLSLEGAVTQGDLSPLKGMPLTYLNLRRAMNGSVRNLTPLKGMPLTTLYLDESLQLSDLTPLQGMPLATLSLVNCRNVSDLTPLKSMPLTTLRLDGCSVRDLTPLEGLKPSEVTLPGEVGKGMAVLRRMKSLGKIQDLPTEEFWKQYDAGKFPQWKE